jgi:hypothetical protein
MQIKKISTCNEYLFINNIIELIKKKVNEYRITSNDVRVNKIKNKNKHSV